MKLLVTGGRTFSNDRLLRRWLSVLHEEYGFTKLAQGGARGADALSKVWAVENGIEVITYRANWERYGYSAGPIRNKEMLEDFKPDVVVAFPGGSGTRHMVKLVAKTEAHLYIVE